ncbi:MAG: hypothetical protein ABJB76_04535 [Candidatus Nitrosocosmicus sp.]
MIQNCNVDDLKVKLHYDFKMNENGFILVNNLLLGRTDNESMAENIKQLIKDIPFHKDILDELKNLRQSLLDIYEKSDKIHAWYLLM